MCSVFFGKYLVIDVCPLLPECHGSEVIFDWPMRRAEGKEAYRAGMHSNV